MLRLAVIAVALAGCIPTQQAASQPSYFTYYVPVVPLAAYPPPPFYYYPPPPVPDVHIEMPSLAARALSGKISAAASDRDCANAIAAGDELEKIDADAHHAMLAVDQRYAACIRGF